MQAPGGPEEDPAGGFKLLESVVSPSGVVAASYVRAGDVKTGLFAQNKPSAAELTRRKERWRCYQDKNFIVLSNIILLFSSFEEFIMKIIHIFDLHFDFINFLRVNKSYSIQKCKKKFL
ncbi:hypothetical protein Ltuc_1295 [Legionella tucsonensis]|uniref:Uncharacterized protein n=2 Tax=Legionella tucsonensis TaxID=40335 RepID=A0A0W0ZWI6_9GAMM|nr:hypothetical protein Ltuc_1295 [Legionella tucsonensis]